MKVTDIPFIKDLINEFSFFYRNNKSRKVTWLPLCSTFSSSSIGCVSREALPNSLPLFKELAINSKRIVKSPTPELICFY